MVMIFTFIVLADILLLNSKSSSNYVWFSKVRVKCTYLLALVLAALQKQFFTGF